MEQIEQTYAEDVGVVRKILLEGFGSLEEAFQELENAGGAGAGAGGLSVSQVYDLFPRVGVPGSLVLTFIRVLSSRSHAPEISRQ
eukprot:335973-Hanusia_phi.AAC.1